jgi:hypothetical protein
MAKVIVSSNPAHLSEGKSAIMTPASILDQFSLNHVWRNASEHWQPGQQVDEIHHYGHYHRTVGDVLAVRSEKTGEIVCHVQVDGIVMADAASLTDEDVADLGFASHEAMEADEAALGGHGIWLMRVLSTTPVTHTPAR